MEVDARNVLPSDLMLPPDKMLWKTNSGKKLPILIKNGIVQVKSGTKFYPIMVIPVGWNKGTYFIVVHSKKTPSKMLYKGNNTQEGSLVANLSAPSPPRKQGMGRINPFRYKQRLADQAERLARRIQQDIANRVPFNQIRDDYNLYAKGLRRRGIKLIQKGNNRLGTYYGDMAKQTERIVNRYTSGVTRRAIENARANRRRNMWGKTKEQPDYPMPPPEYPQQPRGKWNVSPLEALAFSTLVPAIGGAAVLSKDKIKKLLREARVSRQLSREKLNDPIYRGYINEAQAKLRKANQITARQFSTSNIVKGLGHFKESPQALKLRSEAREIMKQAKKYKNMPGPTRSTLLVVGKRILKRGRGFGIVGGRDQGWGKL